MTSQWNGRIQRASVSSLRPFSIMLINWLVTTQFTENRVQGRRVKWFLTWIDIALYFVQNKALEVTACILFRHTHINGIACFY